MPIAESPVTFAVGDVQVSGAYARPDNPFATLVVAHGAGAGMEHPFLRGFTRALNDDGVATLRFNFPYREAGRKFPDRPPAAIAAWRAAMDEAAARSAAHSERAAVGRRQVVRRAHGVDGGGRRHARRRPRLPRLSAAPAGQAGEAPRRAPLRAGNRRCCSCRERATPSPRRSCSRASFRASARPRPCSGARAATTPSLWPDTKRSAEEIGASLAGPAAAFMRANSHAIR